MIKLYSPVEIRAAEQKAIQNGVDEIELMRRAAEGLLQAIPSEDTTVAIVCGKGNNAGDGYALAHLLKQEGRTPILCRISEKCTPAAAHYYGLCKEDAVHERNDLLSAPFEGCTLIVDCILGTGFHGEVTSPLREWIEAINASLLPVLSADIPSGLSAENGLGKIAVSASRTVAIGGYKRGHFLGRARDLCGKLTLCDIGITPVSSCLTMEDSDLTSLLRPRPHHCHKGTYGTVTLLGGSLPYSGAPRLSALALASLRSGCGIARLAIPSCIAHTTIPHLLEATVCPMPDEDGHMAYDEEALQTAFAGASAAAIGMGMSLSDANWQILGWALRHLSIPIVIDADGLNTLSRMDLDLLLQTKCKPILTPHPKEFSRLSKLSMTEILERPIESAASFAARYHCIVLLKGTATVVTDGKMHWVIYRGSGGMATAGSGDVLSGVLAGLLAWSEEDLLTTVAAGAHLCGVAGEIASAEMGTISHLASDTARAIPAAIRKIVGENFKT